MMIDKLKIMIFKNFRFYSYKTIPGSNSNSEFRRLLSVVLSDSTEVSKSIMTRESQILQAKEVTNYFSKSKRDKQILDGKIIGWTPKNEVTNGRWVMIGLLIGFLTEYATGVSLIGQIKLTISYLGIVDISD